MLPTPSESRRRSTPSAEVAERVLAPPERDRQSGRPALRLATTLTADAADGANPLHAPRSDRLRARQQPAAPLGERRDSAGQRRRSRPPSHRSCRKSICYTQTGAVSSTLAPGIPGTEGFILSSGTGTRTYAQAELGLQWMLYDFGRTSGRHMQAVWRERIAEFQLVRARQTVEFDVAATYLDVLLANASRRVEEDAVRRADAMLHDTVARRENGDGLREDVLRAEVQLSESRENLIRAREREFDALAGLNNVMGRNASLPLDVVELEMQPPLPGSLADLLAEAASLRPEVRIAQQSVAAAQEGRRVAQADFLPEVFVRAAAGHVDGQYVVTGWQQGAGLHLVSPLYDGGKRRGELRSADADVQAAFADAQNILDTISLQVNLAYRGVMASRECIDLSRTAVVAGRRKSPHRQRQLPQRQRDADRHCRQRGRADPRPAAVLSIDLHLPRRPGSHRLRHRPESNDAAQRAPRPIRRKNCPSSFRRKLIRLGRTPRPSPAVCPM